MNPQESDTRPAVADGVWVSRDGMRAVLLAQTRASGSDTDGQQRALETIRRVFDEVTAADPAAARASRLLVSGPGVFAVSSRKTIRDDVARLSTFGVIGIVGLMLVVYRSLPALALGMLPVISGALAGIAAVSVGFGVVHGLTLGFGTTLIGEAVDYSIYLFVQSTSLARENSTGDRARWVATFWPTVRLGMLTSVVGFATLLFSGFPGLAQLGLYSIAGNRGRGRRHPLRVADAAPFRIPRARRVVPGPRARGRDDAGAARCAGFLPACSSRLPP